jgi:hypothetical protein
MHEALSLGLVVVWAAAPKAAYYASSNASLAIAAIKNPGAASSDREFNSSRVAEERVQTDLLRDIFDYLLLQTNIDSAWLAWHNGKVPNIAQAIYDEHGFSRLPILADDLEEAGCDNAEVLAHLRGPGPHVRGCWVLDLLLGKE